jgi:CheY-like chemotaxis protein
MARFSKVLVIAESLVFRKVLARVLGSHAERVLTAASAREGRQRIAENADISLVLSEVVMHDGDAFQLLHYVAALAEPKPRVLLLAAQPEEEEAGRALKMGAIGYLAKPTSLQDISLAWRRSEGPMRRVACRVRSLGRAILLDPSQFEANLERVSHLAWDIRNISVTGAFLETKAPLPISTELHLGLAFGDAVGHVNADVVRVQEPSWGSVGGVGIAFRSFGEGTKELLTDYVSQALKRSAELTAAVLAPDGAPSA